MIRYPLVYKVGETKLSLVNDIKFRAARVLKVQVGDVSFSSLVSGSPLHAITAQQRIDYNSYMDQVLHGSIASTNHMSALGIQPTISFIPDLDDQNRGVMLHGVPISSHEIEDITLKTKMVKFISDLTTSLAGASSAGQVNAVTPLLATALRSKGWNATSKLRPSCNAATEFLIGTPGTGAGDVLCAIPKSSIGHLFDLMYIDKAGTTYQPTINCSLAYFSANGISLSSIGTGYANATSRFFDLTVPLTVSRYLQLNPAAEVFALKVCSALGCDSTSIRWCTPAGVASTSSFTNPEFFIEGFQYSLNHSAALGRVQFELELINPVLKKSALIFENPFGTDEITKDEFTVESFSVNCAYKLSQLSDKLSGEQVTEFKSFITAHPRAVALYYRQAVPLYEIGVRPLEVTQLYSDARSAEFDILSEKFLVDPPTTFKTVNNYVNGEAGKRKRVVGVRTYFDADLEVLWSKEQILAATWSTTVDNILIGSLLGVKKLLHPQVAEEKELIEYVLFVNPVITYHTTEGAFILAVFNVASRAILLGQLSAVSLNTSTSQLELSPTVIAPNGVLRKGKHSEDEWYRLLFSTVYLSKKELENVVEGALGVAFNW